MNKQKNKEKKKKKREYDFVENEGYGGGWEGMQKDGGGEDERTMH